MLLVLAPDAESLGETSPHLFIRVVISEILDDRLLGLSAWLGTRRDHPVLGRCGARLSVHVEETLTEALPWAQSVADGPAGWGLPMGTMLGAMAGARVRAGAGAKTLLRGVLSMLEMEEEIIR